jgi:flagellar motility protein MotE (MotC chaperone)
MANTGTDAEHSAFGAFERFLIWFFIPLVFTSVLLGVLLSIFDYNVKNSLLKIANEIPGVKAIVPDPQQAEPNPKTIASEQVAAKQKQLTDEVTALNGKIADQDAALKKADSTSSEKDQNIKDLQAKIADLEQQLKGKTQTDDEYKQQIQQLAAVYAQMTSSKSAPILENLTLQERALIMSQMKTADRVNIFSKMDPKIAAVTSVELKDMVPLKDREIAALQERLKVNEPADAKAPEKLSKEDLSATIASMAPKSAAALLVEMMKSKPDQVVTILANMDASARSQILSAISDISKESAVTLTTKLGF